MWFGIVKTCLEKKYDLKINYAHTGSILWPKQLPLRKCFLFKFLNKLKFLKY